jgi:hypothetical protein
MITNNIIKRKLYKPISGIQLKTIPKRTMFTITNNINKSITILAKQVGIYTSIRTMFKTTGLASKFPRLFPKKLT